MGCWWLFSLCCCRCCRVLKKGGTNGGDPEGDVEGELPPPSQRAKSPVQLPHIALGRIKGTCAPAVRDRAQRMACH